MRCPLCGLQARLTKHAPMKAELDRPPPRLPDGPYRPMIRQQTIGGALPPSEQYGASAGLSEWTTPEELNQAEVQFLREKLADATALVAKLQPAEGEARW
jgi:hypothetical protein